MKKVVSFISALAMMASLAFSVSAASEPTLSLEVSSTGLKAGDTVTVTCKYDGFAVTPYNDNEGAGQKVTGAQVRINIPGGIGTAAAGKQFLRPGLTNTSGFSTGAPVWNVDMNNAQFTAVISNIDDSMQTSGTVFTLTMKLNQDVTSDLAFDFVSSYEQTIAYDNYTDWTMGDTVQIKNPKTVGATLKAPVTKTLSSIAVDKTAIEVAGEATYDLSQIVTTATYSDASQAAVTPTWTTDKGSISGTTFTAPAAIVDKPQTVTLTATYEGKTATVTVTVPAAPKPEFSCSATPADPYYRKATGQVIRRFDCSAVNSTDVSSFVFTCVGNGITKKFTSAKPATVDGGAAFEFEVMILGAPADTTLTVTAE